MPNDVAARFGRHYLASTFFPQLIQSTAGCIIAAELDGKIEGFCVLATDPAAMNAAAKSRPIQAVRALGSAVVGDPKLAYDVWTSLFGVRRALDRNLDLSQCAEIYLMAVTPQTQGKGIGAAVIEEALRDVRTGCIAKTASVAAASFYARHGFAPVGRELRGNRQLQILYREGN